MSRFLHLDAHVYLILAWALYSNFISLMPPPKSQAWWVKPVYGTLQFFAMSPGRVRAIRVLLGIETNGENGTPAAKSQAAGSGK